MIAKSFARIHRRNLVNYGVLPLTFRDPNDHDRLAAGDTLCLGDARVRLGGGRELLFDVRGKAGVTARHDLTSKEIEIVLAGGLINWRQRKPDLPRTMPVPAPEQRM